MVAHKIALASFFSTLLLCQASPFVYEDYFAYPRYALELTDKKIPESSVFGHQQGRHIGQWNNKVHSNGEQHQVIMMTANAQPFLCTIPAVTIPRSNQHSSFSADTNPRSSHSIEETLHTIERGLELLKPLENRCLYYNPHGYWTYEYCHGRHVRQFHIDSTQVNNGGGDTVLVDDKSSYILGTFPNHQEGNRNGEAFSTDTTNNEPLKASQQQQHAILDKKQSSIFSSDHTSTTLRHIGGQEQQHQVLVQHWNDGTPCDITNQPRTIDIQYQCAVQDTDQIAFFEEVSTCHYRMIIATPRLCDDLALGAKKQIKSHSIECNPIVPEYQIIEHEQQQQQQEDILKDHTSQQEQQQQQSDEDNANILMSQSSDMNTEQSQQQQPTGDAILDEDGNLAQSDLIGMISNLAKQVNQLQRSMEQQHAMDYHLMQQQQQQQQQQQNPIVFMDQHGQWMVAPGTTLHDRDSGLTAQTFLKQFFSNGVKSSPPSSFKGNQKQSLPEEGSGSQQQNRKAYEKNYYA